MTISKLPLNSFPLASTVGTNVQGSGQLGANQTTCHPMEPAQDYTCLDQKYNFMDWSIRPVRDKDSCISCGTDGTDTVAEESWKSIKM